VTPIHVFQLILGAMAVALLLPIATRRLPIPPAAALVLGGVLLAAIPRVPVIAIDPDLVMTLFLPPLLMASAFFTVWRDFRANLRPILLLAIGAVTFTTFLVGCAARWAMPVLPWGACFALGAIVSPPDAVAAKAVLHTLPLPRRVVTILEGESLVNDASGLLLYRFAVAAALTGAFHPAQAAMSFIWLSAGGIAFGIAAGRFSLWVLSRLRHSHEKVLSSFLTAWITYIAADLLGISSVLAVVACGLIWGWGQHEVFNARDRSQMGAVWNFVVTVFETLVFVLIGLSLRGVLDHLGGMVAAVQQAAPLTIAIVLVVVVSRFLWVIPGMYLSRLLSPALRKHDPFSAPIGIIASWAGMRGVVSLAAAMALPTDFPGRDLLLFATFAVIVVTVLLQGATLGPLIRLMLKPGTDQTGQRPRYEELEARVRVMSASLQYLETLTVSAEVLPEHAGWVEQYRRRLDKARQIGDMGEQAFGTRATHFGTALAAVAAGRAELIQMHHAGAIHDTVVRALEAELDLEELRLRRLAGEEPA
jgi:monovalent cation/hydrogen antiporter